MTPITSLNLSNTKDLKVHKLANVFPMLSSDELNDLSCNIEENGLLESIDIQIIEGENYLLDGRNRLAACRLVNVEPIFSEYKGDPAKYIYAKNINRRHLSKSQRAMAQAILQPKGEQGKRNDLTSGINAGSKDGPSERTVRQARAIIREAPELVRSILDGKESVGRASSAMKGTTPVKTPKPVKAKKSLKEVGFDAPATETELKKMTDSLRDCLAPEIKAGMTLQIQEWFTDECEHIIDFVEEAAKKYTKKSLNAFARMLRYHDRVYQETLVSKLPKEVKLYKKELEAREAELDERERGIVKRSKRLKHILTDKEVKLLKGCLHPDAVPEGKKEKYGKAFQALMKAI